MRKKIKKPKEAPKITLWAVIDREYPETPVTFTATKDDAEFALDQYLYLKHYTHFTLWCDNHNLKVDHAQTWRKYINTVMNDELTEEQRTDPSKAPYVILQIDYEMNVIASLLRTMNHCTPLGCSFDTEEELDEYAYYYSCKAEQVAQGKATFTPMELMYERLFKELDEHALDDDLPDIDSDHRPNNAA